MPRRNTHAKKRSHKRRSTLRHRRYRGGADCPPGWEHTDAQEAAVILQQTKKDFEGTVTYTDYRDGGKSKTVKILKSRRLGGYCVDDKPAITALANNYSGYLRANPGGIVWNDKADFERPAGW